MAENKSGLHRIISAPWVYNTIQFVAGANLYRERMVRDYIKPFDGCRVLDIGCGTGEYVPHLEKYCRRFEYVGFDGEAGYIEHAKEIHRARPNVHFHHKVLDAETVKEFNDFDIVLAMGVMHHLDDALVTSLLKLSALALKPGGRLLTYDPGKFERMSVMEKVFVRYDRGRSIRFAAEYEALISPVFPRHRCESPYLTYYPSRNVVFECFKDASA